MKSKFNPAQPVKVRYIVASLVFLFAGGWYLAQTNAQAAGKGINSPQSILPVPAATGLDAEVVELGDRLFHDKRLSANSMISCASCHNLKTNGADGLARSKGINGATGVIKAPTVYNSCFNFVQFWDGRARRLNEQIDGPVNNPSEMGTSWTEIILKLRADKDYQRVFGKLYDDGINEVNIKHAIVAFECSLVTINAPFDRYLRGYEDAITEQAKEGFRLFKSYGCIACHQGANVGGNMYQHMGVVGNYFQDRDNITRADLGRFNVTGDELDRHLFKVPSLRLAVRNSPYFHDGSAKTLEEAIKVMAKYQLGRRISDEDVTAIIVFLGTLVGEHPRLGL